MGSRFLAVLLASSFVLAMHAPASFAQAVAEDGGNADDSDETNVTVVDCSQVQQAVQGQYGDAQATADDGSVAEAANSLGISQNQVNACLGGFNSDGGPGGGNPNSGPNEEGAGAGQYEGEGAVDEPEDVVPGSGTGKPLPNTGGFPLPLGAAALILAALLTVRRIVAP